MKRLYKFLYRHYERKDIFTVRKAEYTFLFLGLMLSHAVFANVINIIFANLTQLETAINILTYIVFIIVFTLLLKGRLTIALNIFISIGIVRCFKLYSEPASYEFYIFIAAVNLATGFVHVKKYQLYFVYILTACLATARIFMQYRLYTDGQTEIHAFYQSLYAWMLLLIFLIMIHKLDKIISLEIEKTKELERISNTDPLTGAYNRRKFDSYVADSDMWVRPVSIILLDIDHFKKINDQYGHATGDMVLQKLVYVLQKSLRKDDLLTRWGGEEFIIILQDNDLKSTLIVSEKIRLNVKNYKFGNFDYPITVSQGLAEHSRNESIEKTIQRADNALYRAKALGRNRIETENL